MPVFPCDSGNTRCATPVKAVALFYRDLGGPSRSLAIIPSRGATFFRQRPNPG